MSINLKNTSRAAYWKRLGEPANTVPGPQDSAQDNNYQQYVLSSTGGAVPTSKQLNASNQFEITAGHALIDGSITLAAISPPATPTIANVGTAGATTYTYAVVAMSGNLPAPAATASTATGNGTLTSANYNTITFSPVVGANSYIVYRTVGGSTQGIIAVIVGGYLTNSPTAETIVVADQALVADGSTAPTVNITGSMAGDLNVYGNINSVALATPATPSAKVNGTAGATTNAYKIVARSGSPVSPTGHTAASAAISVTTCNATLTSTNSVTLKWQPVPGAIGYDVYRTTSGGTPSTTGKINTTLVLTAQGGFTDTGLAGDSTTAPTTNTTGQFTPANGAGTQAVGTPTLQVAHATYNFATDGGAIGLITPAANFSLPANAIVYNSILNFTTPGTSGGSATASIGLSGTGGGAAVLLAATAVASLTGILQSVIVPQTASGFKKITTAGGQLTLTIATATLTAGVLEAFVFYVASPS